MSTEKQFPFHYCKSFFKKQNPKMKIGENQIRRQQPDRNKYIHRSKSMHYAKHAKHAKYFSRFSVTFNNARVARREYKFPKVAKLGINVTRTQCSLPSHNHISPADTGSWWESWKTACH